MIPILLLQSKLIMGLECIPKVVKRSIDSPKGELKMDVVTPDEVVAAFNEMNRRLVKIHR